MENPDLNAFGKYIPGFDFLQGLVRQATGSVAPGLQSVTGAMPPLGSWVAPTFSVEEIEKRIQDLRAVQFWLDQNAKALGATVQALEVQKMTLATLKGMNLSLQDVAESFKIRPEPAPAPAPAPAPSQPANPFFFKASAPPPKPEPEPQPQPQPAASAQPQPEPARPAVDPMQWWSSLTEQFTTIAASAMQDMTDQAAKAAEHMAQTVQASTEAAEKAADQLKQQAAAPQAAPVKRPARAGTAAKSPRAASTKPAAAARDKSKAGG